MARLQRMKSATGIYHIMLRGINKQQVFFNDDDYYMFLQVLSRAKTISGFKLHAYCLMSNHIHLLIQEGEEPLSKVFKRIGDSFVYRYNEKHDRCGAIFQGRYKSIPVNDDEYYITVLRYIHQNPIKAGIVEKCSDYEFSSYNAYFSKSDFVNTGFALELIGVDQFERIHTEQVDDNKVNLGEKAVSKVSDDEAASIFKSITGGKSEDDFKNMPKDMKIAYIKQLRSQGLTITQVINLTGVSQRTAEGR